MSQRRFERLAAIIVTFNRKLLLVECINAVLRQTVSVDLILIIDNASTDGTRDILNENGFLNLNNVEYVRMESNIGGAGGFHNGLKKVYDMGYEWMWVMDDDTIPESIALEELFKAYQSFDEDVQPKLLASRVLWKDKTLHPMNIPNLKTFDWENQILASIRKTLSIRSTSFVSLVLNRSLINKYGFPIANYLIWNDDAEFTARILKNEFGILVPESIVFHKTNSKYTPIQGTKERFFFEVRNKVWMVLKSQSWSNSEKFYILVALLRSIFSFVRYNKFNLMSFKIVFMGIINGVFHSPLEKVD